MATRTVMLSSVYSKPFIWNVNGYKNGLAQWLKMTPKVCTSFWPPFAPYFFHQENWVQNVHVARKVTLLRVHQSVLETLFIRGYHVSPGSCWPLAWRFLVHHHQNKSSRETHKHWWWTSRSASRDEKCTKHASYHKKKSYSFFNLILCQNFPFHDYKLWVFLPKNREIIRISSYFFPASFYGSGYASLPFEDAQSTTDLSFRFRTSRAESLLVLVAGRTDYCLVMLQAGAVKVRYDYCLWPPLLWPTSLRSLKWKLWYCAIIVLTVYEQYLIWWGNTSLNFLKLQVWEILGVAACQSHLQTCRLVWKQADSTVSHLCLEISCSRKE